VLLASVPAAGNRARDWWPGLRATGRDARRFAMAAPRRERRQRFFNEMGAEWFFTPETPLEHVAAVGEQMKAVPPRLLLRDLRRAIPDAPRPETPMLVVAGEHDRTIPLVRQRATADRYGADLLVAQGVGHQIPVAAEWLPAAEMVEGWLRATLANRAAARARDSRPLTELADT
jgi:pimeloyl-ACP methyl ester carboxylesterase